MSSCETVSDSAETSIGTLAGVLTPEASHEENTMTTTTNTNNNTARSMHAAAWLMNRLDLRLLTLIGAVSCAAGTVGLHC